MPNLANLNFCAHVAVNNDNFGLFISEKCHLATLHEKGKHQRTHLLRHNV